MHKINKKKKLINIIIFILIFLATDLSLTQFYLFKFYYKNLEKQYILDLKNRIPNKDYKYTFKEKASFISNYMGHEYLINTNNLGFRDYKIRDLEKKKKYTIVIGDSFVEGVALQYEDTLVSHLNNKIEKSNIKNYEFLNAGVSSYSPYIYKRKVISVIEKNNWLKTSSVILLLDKSDVPDEIYYFDPVNRPKNFPEKKEKHSFKYNEDFFDDLKRFDLWRFFSKQTTTGLFLKRLGDIIDLERRNLRDRYKLSKKIKKSFFEITRKQVNSFRSINTRKHFSNYFYGNLWETKGKKSIDFSIENIEKLKTYLDNKKIKLLVVLYPWPYEFVNKTHRENYTNYIIKKLSEKRIDFVSTYKYFLEGDIYSNISDYYIYNDMHFTGRGNELLSEIIWNSHLKKLTSQ